MASSSKLSVDDDHDGNLSKSQHTYVQKCLSLFKVNNNLIHFDPDNYVSSGISSPDVYYRKPVIIMAPHLQFGPIGKCLQCGVDIKPDGWSPTIRKVEDLHCCSSLVQHKYKCNCGSVTADSLLNGELVKVSDYMKLFYPVTRTDDKIFDSFRTNHNCQFSFNEINDVILNNAPVGSSFTSDEDEIITLVTTGDFVRKVKGKGESICWKQAYKTFIYRCKLEIKKHAYKNRTIFNRSMEQLQQRYKTLQKHRKKIKTNESHQSVSMLNYVVQEGKS